MTCPSPVIEESKSMFSPTITTLPNSFDFYMAVITIKMLASSSASYTWMPHCLNSFLHNPNNWFLLFSFLKNLLCSTWINKFLLTIMSVQVLIFKIRNLSEFFDLLCTGSDGFTSNMTATFVPLCFFWKKKE